MKLILRSKKFDVEEFTCKLTHKLDELSGRQLFIDNCPQNKRLYEHYLQSSDLDKKDNVLLIKVPGEIVGSILYDENIVITKIYTTDNIDKNYRIKNLQKELDKFVGLKIDNFNG